jgi:hypothetical protein
MKTIASYIGYVMAVWGVVMTIWTLATKNTDKKYNVIDIQKDVLELKADVASLNEKADTAVIYYTKIQRAQNAQEYLIEGVVVNQNILKSSFVKHLEMDKRYTELVTFLQGYQFDLQKAVSDSVQFKILINKIKK